MAHIPISTTLETTWDASNPADLNYLKPNSFRLMVRKLPNVSFFCQSINIPNIQIGEAQLATPLHDLFYPGEKLRFDDLNIRFLVQENMANYRELYNWLIQLGNPESTAQYNFSVSDASLVILNSSNIPITNILFQDLYPISLGSLDFDLSSGDTGYLQGSATFRYRQYTFESV